MQKDGNFVLVDNDMKVKFSSETRGNPGAKLAFSDSCDFRIVSPSGEVLWKSSDQCGQLDKSDKPQA